MLIPGVPVPDSPHITKKEAAEGVTEEKEKGILYRASNGKTKISTLVQPQNLDRFNADFSTLQRTHMENLKKKDKAKKKVLAKTSKST